MKELDFLFVTPKAPLTARWYPPPDNIVDINGGKWIIGHRHKTGIPFQVKLMDIPLQIIDRYKHLQGDKLVFGKMNYWSMCKKLKTVMEACGIKKQISYHCGRHSFATLALSKGMPCSTLWHGGHNDCAARSNSPTNWKGTCGDSVQTHVRHRVSIATR